MKTLSKCILTILLCLFMTTARSQPAYFQVSADTLYTGETNEFLINVGDYSAPGNLDIFITPYERIDDDICPECNNDTIRINSIQFYNDTIVSVSVPIPYGTYPERYKIEYYDTGIPSYGYIDEYLFIASRPYLMNHPDDQTVCLGTDLEIGLNYYEPGIIMCSWYLDDVLLDGVVGNRLQLTDITTEDLGKYSCVAMNDIGTDTVKFNVLTYTYPGAQTAPEGIIQRCMDTGPSVYELPEDDLISEYTWVIIPDSAATMTPNNNSVSVDWNEGFTGDAQIFSETKLENCTGPNSDTTLITVVGPSSPPEICIVGLDETENKYRVVWNKLDDASLVEYTIYRESNISGEYLALGTVPAGELSVFTDPTSSPSTISHSYALSYTDTCGNESELSPVHNTIHLSANVGTTGEHNLIWKPYEGFAFLSYDIYMGTKPGEMELLQQVNSSVTSYTNFNPAGEKIYYQIVVSRDGQCNPVKKSTDYSVTKSNIAEFVTGIKNSSYHDLSVYPNPAKDHIQVELENVFSGSFDIYDLTGRKLITKSAKSANGVTIDVSNLETGTYILLLNNNGRVFIEKFSVR